MLRRWIKYLLAFALYYSGVVPLYLLLKGRSGRSEVVLLGYHRVLDPVRDGYDYTQRALVTWTGVFERQLGLLKRLCGFISFRDLPIGAAAPRPLPRLACIVALDGWRDTYERAYPVLRAHGLRAAVFLTTDFVGADTPFWHTKLAYLLLHARLDRLEERSLDPAVFPAALIAELLRLRSLRRPLGIDDIDGPIEAVKHLDRDRIEQAIHHLADRLEVSLAELAGRRFLLSWDEVSRMANDSLEFASHSCTHRVLPSLPRDEVRDELVRSRHAIESHVRAPVTAFACPNGECTPAIRQQILEAGYTLPLYRFNERDTLDHDRFQLRRLCVHNDMSMTPWGTFSRCLFAFELSGLRDLLPV